MLGYATVGSNDLEKAKIFYDALLGSVGMTPLAEHPSGGGIYAAPGSPFFGVLGPFDKEPATVGNGSMFGFALKSREDVDRFHAKALELGGRDEGAPGLRGAQGAQSYFTYVRDLDGNKLCAFCMGG